MEESTGRNLEKLRHLLVHWVEHNQAHEEGYLKWIERAESEGRQDVAGEIQRSLELSKEMSRCFERAKGLLKED
ncbi:MAG: hypothetical protein R3231_10505 [bacterium]|nr:hypothetical protein [bacterium]